MDKQGRLVLSQKIYDMAIYGFDRISNFNRNYRDTLGMKMDDSINFLLESASRLEKKYNKKNTLQEMDIENDVLKKYIRMARDKHFISVDQYGYWSKQCVEIGKILGGMINSDSEKRNDEQRTFVCSKCGKKISAKEYKFSTEKFGKSLCIKCQKIERERRR